ncbi:hypothetical protein [Methanochimaera problematica]|uniref:hypothetical protein n=1 Tax=Methanochimaera problematica TaxID=2609417 RepID=UPI0029395425|nr:hypothetical protein [Methanoplanus sp. FWC-SCC4]
MGGEEDEAHHNKACDKTTRQKDKSDISNEVAEEIRSLFKDESFLRDLKEIIIGNI